MKIQYVSDLHLEGASLELNNTNKADLLILAGDITTAKSYKAHEDFFKRCSDNWADVVFVAGNHEFYRGDIEETRDELFQWLYERFKNVHFLDDDTIYRKGFWVFGGTLWTDCNKHDPLTKLTIQGGMNDYRLISMKSKKHWKLRPEDTIEIHNQFLDRFKDFLLTLEVGEQVIVVTHHGPSRQSIHPRFANDFHMNGGYVSDLEPLMTDKIPLWFHGHVHNTFDYTIGKTRVLTNPRGYVTLGRDSKRYT